MFNEVILPIALILGFVAFFFYITRQGKKMLEEHKSRINKAVKARAKIIGISLGSMSGRGEHGNYRVYEITMEVFPNNGTQYKAKSNWEVYDMGIPAVQEGKEISIKIDSQDQKIIYPNSQWIEYSWAQPVKVQ